MKYMTSGPSVICVISKGDTGEGIIEEWRELLGPTSVEDAKANAPQSLRAKYGQENYVNAVHGSDTTERAMTLVIKSSIHYSLTLVLIHPAFV